MVLFEFGIPIPISGIPEIYVRMGRQIKAIHIRRNSTHEGVNSQKRTPPWEATRSSGMAMVIKSHHPMETSL